MVANNWMAQFLANIVGLPVTRAPILETTALGAARLAGFKAGVYESLKADAVEVAASDSFQPDMPDEQRAELLAGWRESVKKVLSGSG